MSLPSIKTLKEIAHERAGELRKVLEIDSRAKLEAVLDKYPVTDHWYRSCYHPMPIWLAKMSIASEITECHGVEHVDRGRNAKSPAFDYVNAGDAYEATLVRLGPDRYRVACWGDIVERGDYA